MSLFILVYISLNQILAYKYWIVNWQECYIAAVIQLLYFIKIRDLLHEVTLALMLVTVDLSPAHSSWALTSQSLLQTNFFSNLPDFNHFFKTSSLMHVMWVHVLIIIVIITTITITITIIIISSSDEEYPQWFSEGKTLLIPKLGGVH